MKLSPETIARFEASRPRPFDLTDPSELDRLLRETIEYAGVSLHYGTDSLGRLLACRALQYAYANGYRLVKVEP